MGRHIYLTIALALAFLMAACADENTTPTSRRNATRTVATTASTRPPATATPATDVEASPTSEDRQAENSGEITVQYRVSGDAKSANIIYVVYEGEKGESRQATVKLPWKKSFDAMEGEFVYVSSQASKRSGSVKCEIVVDGESFKEERADGSSGVASCEGMIGEK